MHHLIPSSQAPHLFWEPQNLQASCARCNYGGGARIAATNTRQTIARLHEIIEQQEQRIEHLVERLAQLEPSVQPRPRREPAQPAIY